MREIALHLLDIAENSIAAEAERITLTVTEDTGADRLAVCVEDNGKGMDAATAEQAVGPFATSRTTRKVGLGIPLLKEAAEACEGGLWLVSVPGKGTRLMAEFRRSHIDRMPLGDLAGTVYTLVVAYPAVHWVLNYTVDGRKFYFDSEPMLDALGDETLITEPEVLRFIRNFLEKGILDVSQTAEPQTIVEAP